MRFTAALSGAVLFAAPSVSGQDLPWWKKAEHWCIGHSLAEGRLPPCNELSHATVALTMTEVSFLVGLDHRDGWAACLPAGVEAFAKETFDIVRWGFRSQIKSTVFDLASSAGGCVLGRWLNRPRKKSERGSATPAVFFVDRYYIGVRLRM